MLPTLRAADVWQPFAAEVKAASQFSNAADYLVHAVGEMLSHSSADDPRAQASRALDEKLLRDARAKVATAFAALVVSKLELPDSWLNQSLQAQREADEKARVAALKVQPNAEAETKEKNAADKADAKAAAPAPLESKELEVKQQQAGDNSFCVQVLFAPAAKVAHCMRVSQAHYTPGVSADKWLDLLMQPELFDLVEGVRGAARKSQAELLAKYALSANRAALLSDSCAAQS